MKIGIYISDLLLDHGSVIFPGLGLFSVQTSPAKFNVHQNILSPPARKLRFIPDVQINDGMLLNYLAQRQKLTAPQAYREIIQICDEIHYRLDHGEIIVFEGLGKLTRSKEEYYFEAFPEAEIHPESFGLEPLNLTLRSGKKVNPPVSSDKGNGLTHQRTIRRGWQLYWLAAIPVLVIAGFVFRHFYSAPDVVPELTNTPAERAEGIIPLSVEPVMPDTVQVVDTNVVPVSAGKNHPHRGLHYLVGGSFRTRENADQYMGVLSEKGMEPIYLGEIQGYYVVALGAYSNAADALAAQRDMLREDPATGAWVYHLPLRD